MQITVAGEKKEVKDGLTLPELITFRDRLFIRQQMLAKQKCSLQKRPFMQ